MRHRQGGDPAATFDLHGLSVLEAVRSAELFLAAQARARPGATVRLITGRGRGGGGAPIRTRVRSLLERLIREQRLVRAYELEEGEGSYRVRLSTLLERLVREHRLVRAYELEEGEGSYRVRLST